MLLCFAIRCSVDCCLHFVSLYCIGGTGMRRVSCGHLKTRIFWLRYLLSDFLHFFGFFEFSSTPNNNAVKFVMTTLFMCFTNVQCISSQLRFAECHNSRQGIIFVTLDLRAYFFFPVFFSFLSPLFQQALVSTLAH